MRKPTVSFVVPCYNLGHFLAECIDSILSQTYGDFEVLVMDDYSPDNTRDVAHSFQDPRITYIRHDRNLGHLQNYNTGIELSGGTYIWLISADDRLRSRDVLERYVRLIDTHPDIGYIFCSGVGLKDGIETTILEQYYYGGQDRIFAGPEFIELALRRGRGILSPSVMVRRACYSDLSLFPLDMPHQADVYLWFLWALEYRVAYMAEPMVAYRLHDASMMALYLNALPEAAFTDEMNVLWRIKRKAEVKGLARLVRMIEKSIGCKYAHAAAFATYGEKCSPWAMDISACEEALQHYAATSSERKRIRGRFYTVMADKHWRQGAFREARRSYFLALSQNWRMPETWLKLPLAVMGRSGFFLRRAAARFREHGAWFLVK